MSPKRDHPGDAEVGQDGLFAIDEEDVGGLDVAMHHAALVGVVERVGNRGPDVDGLLGLKRPLQQPILERRAIDELHHHVVEIELIVVVEVVDLDDVGVAGVATMRASRWKRATKPSSSARKGCITLIATRRWSWACWPL